jgi:tetratricopeptide (TPR) repeat protein
MLVPGAAAADVLADCTQADDWWLRVSACTDAIESGRWEGTAQSWAWSNRAVAHAALGNPLAAFDDHEKAVTLNPADAVAWNNKGNTHADFREYERALAAFDRAIGLDPGYATALYNRAGVHLTLGDHAAAAADYAAVIAVEPEFAEAWAGRAEAACGLGDVAGSVSDRLAAIRLGALVPGEVAAYLRETGYLDAADPVALPRLEAALTAWTAAGCP